MTVLPSEPVDSSGTFETIRGLTIFQRRGGYRYGEDSFLLEGFVDLDHASSILDIGTGCGILGLLLALRYPAAHVTAVELQRSLFEVALQNVAMNGLSDRVRLLHGDVRDDGMGLPGTGFDLVVSNPPYRPPLSGRVSPNEELRIARHEVALTLEELCSSASKSLCHGGAFFVVHLAERVAALLERLASEGLEPQRIRLVHPKAGQPAHLALVKAVKGGLSGLVIDSPICLESGA